MTEARIFPLVTCALLAACEQSFTPYHELEGFRVLSIRADQPALREGETTTLEALTFLERGDPADVRFAWSWCPLRLPSSEGGHCALTEAQVEELLDAPPGSVSFDLGDEPTATFAYPGAAAAVRAACDSQAAASEARPLLVDCEGGLPISIRADITHGEQTIRAQKQLRLVFEDAAPNQNPSLGEVSFRRLAKKEAFAPWAEGETATLVLGDDYELSVDVAADAAESFVPAATDVEPNPAARRESLFLTWFITTGSVRYARTWFIDDSTALDRLGENEWSLPKAGDEPSDTARLFLVLRDERGGVAWTERRVELDR